MSPDVADQSSADFDVRRWVVILLRGVGQVMFQGHAATGLLFVVGMAVAGPLMAIGALLGAIVGPATAHVLRFDRGELADGIYGFNSTLVGVGLIFYLKPEPFTWGLIVLGGVIATVLTFGLRRLVKAPTYTTPFIVTTWIALVIAHAAAGTSIDVKPAPPSATPAGFVAAVLDGAAEVMFGANVATGALFLVGIALSNWRHAAIATLGSIAGTALAMYHNDPSGSISIGIYGYNAALAAMAVYLWRPSLLLPILGAIISVPMTEFFPKSVGLPALTAPFVVASWIVLALGSLEGRFERMPA
ncbi:urea transporter [Tautonia sp. JC769]|uniref:urea transporter n=1 Tax=Tautonia sp. JC769 TaxID=3232135 RepID=UPI0034581B00